MALSAFKRLHQSHYGAVIRDSTHRHDIEGILPPRSVESSIVSYMEDPKQNQKLLILGTSNMSLKLAHRNKVLAEKFKPTSVLVMTSSHFHQLSRGSIQTLEELHEQLTSEGYFDILEAETTTPINATGIFFLYRLALAKLFIHTTMRTPADWWKLFVPGMDFKLILDVADQLKSQVVYAGEEFDFSAYERLRQEKRFDVIYPILKYNYNLPETWYHEARDFQKLFQLTSLKSICESHLNKDVVAWVNGFASKLFPAQKKALIDDRDLDIFHKVEKEMEGERKLLVVNQWHMDGVEKLWRRYHGVDVVRQPTSGVEDCPFDEIKAYMEGTDADRERVEKITGTPMMSHSRQFVPYSDETRSHFG
jgi:hypothetical protein